MSGVTLHGFAEQVLIFFFLLAFAEFLFGFALMLVLLRSYLFYTYDFSLARGMRASTRNRIYAFARGAVHPGHSILLSRQISPTISYSTLLGRRSFSLESQPVTTPLTIKQTMQNAEAGSLLKVNGWIRSVRVQKQRVFHAE